MLPLLLSYYARSCAAVPAGCYSGRCEANQQILLFVFCSRNFTLVLDGSYLQFVDADAPTLSTAHWV